MVADMKPVYTDCTRYAKPNENEDTAQKPKRKERIPGSFIMTRRGANNERREPRGYVEGRTAGG
jgi:hypothetical protein